MSLDKYLKDKGYLYFEGYCQTCEDEVNVLKELVKKDNIKNVLEIGFNAGHSACLFLENNKQCNVVSFDIGYHEYLKSAKEFIDIQYTNRHTLILGDSTKTIPVYENNGLLYDLIFIDGGHDYNVATQDLLNCKRFAHKDTIVVMDDTVYTKDWQPEYTIGPTRAWSEGIQNNLIIGINKIDFSFGRGISWGKYIL
jgi:predicted O-methyltransferase YrrM